MGILLKRVAGWFIVIVAVVGLAVVSLAGMVR